MPLDCTKPAKPRRASSSTRTRTRRSSCDSGPASRSIGPPRSRSMGLTVTSSIVSPPAWSGAWRSPSPSPIARCTHRSRARRSPARSRAILSRSEMRLLLAAVLVASTASAQHQDSVVASRITTLFHALGTGDSAELRRTVTSDFFLFEHARWNADTLLRLMPAVHGRHWSPDSMRVTVAEPLAYVTYVNHSEGAPIYWLESAVLRHAGSTPPSPTEMTAFRVRYPATMKADSGVHYHLGTEHATILKGTLMVGFGDTADYAKMKAYGPGSFLVIPAGTHHYETMRGEVEAQIEAVGPMTTIW